MNEVAGSNILVAGGTGLVGANLARRLRELGAHVRASYCSRKPEPLEPDDHRWDFTQFEDCLEATRDMDAVFICAARTFGAKVMREQPTALILPNLQIHSGLLEAARTNRVEKVVCISSSTVYQEAPYPIREDELDLNRPPYELYLGVGWMKRYMEQLARFYAIRYGMSIGMVRPTNIYGPHDKFEGDGSHVLPALIARALRRENPYVIWGDGQAVRDFIYVDDVVDDVLKVLQHYCVCDPINVGSGCAITIGQAAEIILRICGHDVDPVYDTSQPSAIPYRMVNTDKFTTLFGQQPRTPFEEGIRNTIAWCRSVQQRVVTHGVNDVPSGGGAGLRCVP